MIVFFARSESKRNTESFSAHSPRFVHEFLVNYMKCRIDLSQSGKYEKNKNEYGEAEAEAEGKLKGRKQRSCNREEPGSITKTNTRKKQRNKTRKKNKKINKAAEESRKENIEKLSHN